MKFFPKLLQKSMAVTNIDFTNHGLFFAIVHMQHDTSQYLFGLSVLLVALTGPS